MNQEKEQSVPSIGIIRFAWMTIAAVFLVNLSGFVDTLTDSVTGCGRSWPLCYGTIASWTWDMHAWIEFGHRTIVLIMTLMVLALVMIVRQRYGHKPARPSLGSAGHARISGRVLLRCVERIFD